MNINFILSLFVLITLVSNILNAQEKLNLDSLIGLAIKNDLTLQTLVREHNKIKLEQKVTKSGRIPTVSGNVWAGYSNGRYYDPLSNQFTNSPSLINSSGITANWNLYNGRYIYFKSNADELNDQIHALKIELQKREISKDVIKLYYEIIKAGQLNLFYENKRALYQEELSRLKQLFLLKRITYADTSAVSIEKDEIENEHLEIMYHLDMSLHQLGLLVQQTLEASQIADPDTFPAIINNLSGPLFRRYDDTLQLKKSSISYQISQLEIEKAKNNSSLQKSYFRPSIKLSSGMYTGYSSNRVMWEEKTNSSYTYPATRQLKDNVNTATTINLYIPIYDRKLRFVNKQSVVNEEVTQLDKLKTEKKIFFEYSLAKKQLLLQSKKYTIATSRLHETQNMYRNYHERYHSNRLSKVQWFAIHKKLIEIKMERCKAMYQFLMTHRLFELQYGSNSTN